jgi:hypothetical protein
MNSSFSFKLTQSSNVSVWKENVLSDSAGWFLMFFFYLFEDLCIDNDYRFQNIILIYKTVILLTLISIII